MSVSFPLYSWIQEQYNEKFISNQENTSSLFLGHCDKDIFHEVKSIQKIKFHAKKKGGKGGGRSVEQWNNRHHHNHHHHHHCHSTGDSGSDDNNKTTTTSFPSSSSIFFIPPPPFSLFLLLSCLIFICITYQLRFPIHMSSQSSASHKFLPQCFFCVTLSQICSFNLDPCLMPECFPFSSTFQHYYRIPTIIILKTCL